MDIGHSGSVLLSGYYGFHNTGDEAILQAVLESIRPVCGTDSIAILSHDPEDTTEKFGIRSIYCFSPLKLLGALMRCKVLVFGGGSLLQDRTSTRSLLYYLFILRAAVFLRKKVMIFANGIGPVVDRKNRSRVKRVLEKVELITLRDEKSLGELRDMGLERDDIVLTADPVFSMERPSDESGREIQKRIGVPDGPVVLVSTRSWGDDSDYIRDMAALCDRLHSQLGLHVVFAPLHTPNDLEHSRKILEKMTAPAYLLTEELDANRYMSLCACAELVLAVRLHALIFAAATGTPFAGISYDPKINEFVRALGLSLAGEIGSFDAEAAFGVIKDLTVNRDEYAKKLSDSAEEMKKAAEMNTELFKRLITQQE
ncbi:MAG: polysaccharide pyruvyl transferase CsaB [Oscillospiraceae bacterium]|nr:polysaccharide pyruvyl transferase CsaB [Oscillospiraceae bacterium]